MTLRDLEHLISELSPGEKAQVLQWVAHDLGHGAVGIDARPGVSGGEACIVRTRIPVWLLVRMRETGMTEAEILASYPVLRAEDLANAWAYARVHREEIERDILENESA